MVMHQTIHTIRAATGISGIMFIASILAHCKKEYSYEGGTAAYYLLGLNGHCFNPVVSGNYISGASLDASNTVQLQVEVMTIGKYSLQTNSTNGMQFNAAGVFTDTGIQVVTLIGSGKPTNAGIYNFMTVPDPGCSYNIEVTDPLANAATYTIQSVQNLCMGTISGSYTAGTPLNASNTYALTVNVVALGNYSISTQATDGVIFSAAGEFTSFGNQSVILNASGTPSSVGNFTMTPEIMGSSTPGGNGCDFTMAVK